MTNVTARVRILKVERLQNTANGNPRWKIYPEGAGILETEPDAQVGSQNWGEWVGKNVGLTVNGQDKIVHARLLGSAPTCQCCSGSGMHERREYVTVSPDDTDIECSACAGRGESWFDNRPNSCSGYRTLMRVR